MIRTVKFVVPFKTRIGTKKLNNIKSIKFTDKQLKDIKKLSKLLKISPHYFMRWCILATIKAYNNDGVYEDINVLED